MSRSIRMVLLPALAIAGTLTVAQAQDGVDLQYRFTKGDKLHYTVDQNLTMTIPMPGMEGMEIKSNTTLKQTTEVLEVEGSNGRLATAFNAAKIEMVTPGGAQSWDSDDGTAPGDPNTAMFAAVLGKKTKLTMSNKGDVKDIDAKEVADAMREANPMLGAMGMDVDKMAEDQSKQLWPRLKDGAMNVGESFEHTAEVPFPQMGNTSITYKFTLKSVDGGSAVFDITGTGEHTDAGAMGAMGATAELSRCEVKGKFVFDTARGVVKQYDYSIYRTLTVKLDQGGQIVEMSPNADIDWKITLADGGAERPTTPGPEKKDDGEKKPF